MRHTAGPQQLHIGRVYAPGDFFVLRTPLLPFDELLALSAGLASAAALHDPAALTLALAADRALCRDRLHTLLARPELREALYIASPDLEASLELWLAAPEGGTKDEAQPQREQKVERTLARYLPRMAGRATPFGLFASWSVGALAAQTHLAVAPRSACVRHTRLDMEYLFALSNAIARDPALRPALSFKPNTSVYPVAGRLRYIETRFSGRKRSYHLVVVDAGEELLATLERARGGATVATLADALIAADDAIASDEATDYIATLIENQLLVADLAPIISGPEPIHGMIERLDAHQLTAPLAGQLAAVRDALADLDAGGLGAAPERYREVAALLEGLPAKAEPARLFQVDLARPGAGLSLSPALADQILRGVLLLHRIAGPPTAGTLAAFCRAFGERYGGREVLLVEALDEEHGLGHTLGRTLGSDAAPLLSGLSFIAPGGAEHVHWSQRQTLLLEKLASAARAGALAIELSEADLVLLAGAGEPAPLPDSFAVMATVAASSAAALEQGEANILIHSLGGPSAARLLGRFCHADPALHSHVEALLRAEEALDPEALFAEIVHLPEGRLGNVICRPSLRDYEIVYLGQGDARQARQLPVADLLISVEGERITLRSARLGRRVVPRLSSAHNYARGLALYRFLGALQGHGLCGGVSWQWGPLAVAAFLPRVTAGKLVVARARWRIEAAELKALGAASAGAERFQAVQALRAQRGLPRMLVLEDGDNELPLDLENSLSIESLVDLVKGRRAATFVELFPGPDELCASSPDGRYIHELMLPFTRRADGGQQIDHASSPVLRASRPTRHVARSFPPGSEWLYVKLYSGVAGSDQLLREVVAPVVQKLESAGGCDNWFFLRYADPEPHLRLRFHGEPDRLLSALLPALHAAAAPWLRAGLLSRVQLDTYEREVERYGGGEGMLLAEQLFHADSVAALAIIKGSSGDAGMALRWRLALCGIDRLLCSLGFDEAERHTLIRRARDGYGQEFRAGPLLKRQLGEKYRQRRTQIEHLLDPHGAHDAALAPGLAALAARDARSAPIVASLRAAEASGRLSVGLASLAQSYAHMHVNRLLRSAARQQEYVLFELLDRLYEGRAARVRQKQGR